MPGAYSKTLVPLIISAVSLGSAAAENLTSSHELLPRAHNVHVTRGRLVVEGSTAVARIRFFRHDLDAALSVFANDSSFTITSSPSSDALFLAYFNGRFSLVADTDTLWPAIVASGEDDDSWWYELEFVAASPISSFFIRNETLFDIFSDQKHFLYVVLYPSGRTERLYFVLGSAEHLLEVA